MDRENIGRAKLLKSENKQIIIFIINQRHNHLHYINKGISL